MDPALRRTLAELPAEPGCYLMKDRAGEVVYVGKAKSLRSRVRSYFGAARADDRAFVGQLEELLGTIEVIVTRSEKEAVLLENQLIKRHRPRFNVVLRDDKDFIVLRLDGGHPFPRLEVRRAREPRDGGARIFGPYSSASSIRETLRIVNRYFQLRTCSDEVFAHRKRPCILYQIHRCPAPCVYELPPGDYARSVEEAVAFLEGRETELRERLQARMRQAAAALRFEEAALVRDQLQAVERSLEKQRVLLGDEVDRDVFGLHREGPDLVVHALLMRKGKLQDSRSHPFRGTEAPEAELLSSFLAMYYEREVPPDEVLLPVEPEGVEALAEVLSERRGRRVRILTPRRGAKADLLEVADRNAAQGFRSWHEKAERREEALAALARALHLHREPRWIECFDISTFQGALAVGSGVSMRDGEPDKAGYRRYRVKGSAGRGGAEAPPAGPAPEAMRQDDFAMIHEVLSRRLRRGLAEGSFPDLLVVDGGKGQLSAALAAARDLGIATRPEPGNPGVPFVEMVGLAKSRLLEDLAPEGPRMRAPPGPPLAPGQPPPAGAALSRASRLTGAVEEAESGFVREGARSPERVFLPGRKDPVVLRQNSAELFLLTRVRDEAHRFAIEFHRKLRRGRNLHSVLEEIPGVGGARRKALLRTLGSLRRVKEATEEELAAVEGVGPAAARAVFAFFHPPAAGEAAARASGRRPALPSEGDPL